MAATRERIGNVEYDNFNLDGAHSRTSLDSLRLEYAIDVFADERAQSAEMFTLIIADLLQRPTQLVAGNRLSVKPFNPVSDIRREFLATSRVPFFIEMTAPMDVVARQFHAWADPFVQIGPAEPPRNTSESLSI